MHIGRTNQKFRYSISSQNLDTVSDQRDLGIQLTADLKQSTQCQKAYSKARKVLETRTFFYKGRDIMAILDKYSGASTSWILHISLVAKEGQRNTRTAPTSLYQNVSRCKNISICSQITVAWLVVLGRETKPFWSVGISVQNVQRVVLNKLWQHVHAQQYHTHKRTHSQDYQE